MEKHFAIRASLFASLTVLAMMSTSQPVAQKASASTVAPSLDYEFFKTRVEPIFLKKRPGHARCYFCHEVEPGAIGSRSSTFRLARLSLGNTFWTDNQSRLNFEVVSLLVILGDPPSSRLLMHPLSPDAGGDRFHGGGRQFASQNDPDWQTMAEWVRGQKTGGPSDRGGR
jgi:hypothetical protein